jgi:phosphohistidine phosphatase SixA
MKVWVMRHGPAGDTDEDPVKERERGLLPEGKKLVTAIAREMLDQGEEPRTIISSDYARTIETADTVGKMLGVTVDTSNNLEPHMPLSHLLGILADEDEQTRIMIVSHSDNIDPWIEKITGDEDPYAKGEIRRFRLDRSDGSAKERWRLCPSDVGFKDEY